MMVQHSHKLALAAVLAAGMALLPMQVAAQSTLENMGPSVMGGGQQPKSAAEKPKTAPPPALPGAASNPGQAAPATRLPSDMEPTEALFDAINRGDIAAARDAISRGADLSGRNVLGMSPMELAVDLGRKDITFLLLSMRAGDTAPNRAPPSRGAEAILAKAAKQTRQPVRPAPTATASVTQPAARQTAKLFANDGGTPNPNAGFLGFDSARR